MAPELGEKLTSRETEALDYLKEIYQERIDLGVAREQARKDLPLSTYTEAYWKIDLHNLMHFLALRMDDKAQLEIRQYAQTIGEKIVSKWVPLAWEAFLDYRHGAVSLSGDETEILALMNGGRKDEADELLLTAGFTVKDGDSVKPTLEGREFAAKLERMGLKIPWGDL